MHTDCSGGGGSGCPKNEVSLGKQQAEESSQSAFELDASAASAEREGNKEKRNMTEEAAASAVILDKETDRGEEKEGREQEAQKANERKTEHVR